MNRKQKPGTVPNVTKAIQTIMQKAREATQQNTPKQKRRNKRRRKKAYYSTMPKETKMISDYEQCEAMGKNAVEQNNLSIKDKQQQTPANMTKTPMGQGRRRAKRKTLKNQKKSNKQNNRHRKRTEKLRTREMRQ